MFVDVYVGFVVLLLVLRRATIVTIIAIIIRMSIAMIVAIIIFFRLLQHRSAETNCDLFGFIKKIKIKI